MRSLIPSNMSSIFIGSGTHDRGELDVGGYSHIRFNTDCDPNVYRVRMVPDLIQEYNLKSMILHCNKKQREIVLGMQGNDNC